MAKPMKTKAPSKGAPKKDVLASLKMAQIEISKPVLPAELMSSVLDYVGPTDLIHVARTSRRMQEMVYDDPRWVQFLKRMGCWNELEARKHAERTIAQSQNRPRGPSLYLEKVSPVSHGGGLREKKEVEKPGGQTDDPAGFDTVGFVTSPGSPGHQQTDRSAALSAMQNVRSIRGKAREEYGKVHAALSPLYNDLVRTDASTDSSLFKLYDAPEDQAKILSQLKAFSNCDWNAGWEARTLRVLDAVSLFETAALREFRNGYETGDIEGMMAKYAKVLNTLDGGKSAGELFLHHNHLITRKPTFGSPTDSIDPSTGTVSLAHTQAFLTRLSVAFNEEASIMDQCFPTAKDLAAPFLDKVAKGVMTPYFGTLFDEVHNTNTKSYLETVSGTFAQSLDFARNLNPLPPSEDGFHEAVVKVVESVFEPHVDLYLAEELDQFRKQSDAVVQEWDRQLSEQAASTESFYMSYVNRQADKKDFLTSFKKVLMAPVNILPSFSSKPSATPKEDESQSRSRTPEPTANPTQNRSSTMLPPTSGLATSAEPPTTELAAKAAIMNSKLEGIRSLFSIEVALNLVHSAKSSLERTAQFVKFHGPLGQASKQQCQAVFVSLLDILGHRHVIAGFDKAVEHLTEYKPRQQVEGEKSEVEALVTFLELVNVGDLILQMMDVFYEQEMIRMGLVDRSDFLDPAVKEKKKFEQMLDGRVAAGLNKGIDVLMEEVDYILATKQSPEDFYPGSTQSSPKMVDIGPSEAAKSVVQVASTHTHMLVGSTHKSTLDVFNQEIGLRLYTSLCKHLKRQRISVEGSIKLISDMNHYFDFIQSMKNKELLLYFTALRELSQIYLIHASDSKEMASVIADVGRFQGILRAEEVYEFAERRADWYQVKKDVERAMFGIGCLVM